MSSGEVSAHCLTGRHAECNNGSQIDADVVHYRYTVANHAPQPDSDILVYIGSALDAEMRD